MERDARKIHGECYASDLVFIHLSALSLPVRPAHGEFDESSVKYQELIPMLINEVQRQRQALQSQQQEIAELRAFVGQSREKVVLRGTMK